MKSCHPGCADPVRCAGREGGAGCLRDWESAVRHQVEMDGVRVVNATRERVALEECSGICICIEGVGDRRRGWNGRG